MAIVYVGVRELLEPPGVKEGSCTVPRHFKLV